MIGYFVVRDLYYEQNFVDNSQSPPQPQYETYACELCGNDAHYGYDCPPQHAQSEDIYELLRKLLKDLELINKELAEYINSPRWNRPAFYDDEDEEYSIQVGEKYPIAIEPVLPTEEPNNSLNMRDEHLDIIPETELNKVIKSNVEDLVPISSESEGILDNMCDVPFSDKNHFDAESDLISEDDSFEDIGYVEASPSDSELVSLKEVKDEILRVKLLNIHLLIDKIESDHTKETSSGRTTTHANNSLPEYDLFLFEIEPDQGELSSVAIKSILGEPRVYVPNELPTILPFIRIQTSLLLMIPLDSVLKFLFLLELETRFSIRGYLLKSNPRDFYHGRNFLSHSSVILFIQCLTLYSRFYLKTRTKCFKPGILSYLLVSHRDKTTSDFFDNPMMMYGGDIPILDVLYLHFYPP
nr:hypothetical protein [Tanacetum cinerariifolium]